MRVMGHTAVVRGRASRWHERHEERGSRWIVGGFADSGAPVPSRALQPLRDWIEATAQGWGDAPRAALYSRVRWLTPAEREGLTVALCRVAVRMGATGQDLRRVRGVTALAWESLDDLSDESGEVYLGVGGFLDTLGDVVKRVRDLHDDPDDAQWEDPEYVTWELSGLVTGSLFPTAEYPDDPADEDELAGELANLRHLMPALVVLAAVLVELGHGALSVPTVPPPAPPVVDGLARAGPVVPTGPPLSPWATLSRVPLMAA